MADTEKTGVNITAKQAGTFLAAALVALSSYLATGGNTSKSSANYPTRAEFDALSRIVEQHGKGITSNHDAIKQHDQYSRDKVEEIRGRFVQLETWEVEHEKREAYQEQMISNCINSLRGIQ